MVSWERNRPAAAKRPATLYSGFKILSKSDATWDDLAACVHRFAL